MPTGLLQSLRSERADLMAEGDALATLAESAGEYSDEQRTRRDQIVERVSTLDKDISAEEQRQAWVRAAPAEPVEPSIDVPAAKKDEAPAPFASIGEQLQAVAQSTFTHRIDPRLMEVNDWGARHAITGAGEAVGADGGFLVQQDLQNIILDRIFETGILAARCRTINVGPNANGVKIPLVNETSRATGSRFGGVQTYWIDEGESLTASRPKFKLVEFSLKKLTALSYATDELLADATAMDSILDTAMTEELAFALDDAIYDGTGGGIPRGILRQNSLVSVAKETNQAANTILAENVEKMWTRMWPRGFGNATWFVNVDVYPQLFQLHHVIGTGGVPLFVRPGDGLTQSPFGSLLGRPVQVIEQAPTLGTVGDIVFADLSQYALVRKGGVARAASMHVQFTTDEMAFRWILRVQGDSLWLSALTPYKGSNTVSPFVALATRA